MADHDVQADTNASDSHEQESAAGRPDDAAARDDRQVPVSEAIRFRKRAQAAEQQLGDMQAQLQGLHEQFDQAQQTIRHLERRQSIDSLLADSEAIDLDAARLLTERAVAEMDEPDVKAAVADLRRHKPYLFRRRVAEGHGGMAPRLADADAPVAEDLAQQAATSGDRRDLLRYLRLRRKQA